MKILQMNLFRDIIFWIKRPLLFFETTKQKLIVSLVFGLSIIVSLLFFDHPPSEELYISLFKVIAYGLITFLILFFYSYLLPLIFRRFFNPEYWTVGKSLLFGIILVISVGLANTLFAFKFDNPNSRSEIIPFLLAVVYRTFIIGVVPSIIFHFWLEKKLYKRYYLGAAKINKLFKDQPNEEIELKKVSFKTQNNNEEVILFEEELIYIKSEGNYCQIFYQESNTQKKILLRNTLKNMEESLKNSNRILRCHKSYIINLDKVLHVKGNARGYSFIVDGFNYPVPVSRELSKDLLNKITSN